MATIAELQIRRDKLLERLESLQTRVSHGDKTVQFDLSQAREALDLLDREIARNGGSRRIARHLRVRSNKDL
ncbi:conserved hypothetical protein [Magnetococcus marinus MC-1]|uniref:Uncharacterized protein n=1 Tax=Magnetococcus marinus (strain ATCC BAA-1437 / JCM 17883 / MC-1) TaxID=156889 RepID=A0LBP6_MAGMM|nr:hypothetical protein [Magnetococcus marinus]ABK45389.1 conserved hypothetical protein [Magnetococcus marinus MC-1]